MMSVNKLISRWSTRLLLVRNDIKDQNLVPHVYIAIGGLFLASSADKPECIYREIYICIYTYANIHTYTYKTHAHMHMTYTYAHIHVHKNKCTHTYTAYISEIINLHQMLKISVHTHSVIAYFTSFHICMFLLSL